MPAPYGQGDIPSREHHDASSAKRVLFVDAAGNVLDSLAVTGTFWQTTQPVSQASRQTFTPAPVALTSTTSVTQILAADASYGLDLCSLTIENSSAIATEVVVYLDNGTTEVWRGNVPAGDMRGIVFPAGRELTQGAVNKAWKAKTVTSVASVYITLQYIKNTAWAI